MRVFAILAVLTGLLAGTVLGQGSRPSPEFAMKLVDGKQNLLSQYRGKVIALAFLSTT